MSKVKTELLCLAFSSAIEERLGFVEFEASLGSGDVVCFRKLRDSFFAFVRLTIFNGGKINVSLYWSRRQELPKIPAGLFPFSKPERKIFKDEPINGEFAMKLATFWRDDGNFFWEVPSGSVDPEKKKSILRLKGGNVKFSDVATNIKDCDDDWCGRMLVVVDNVMARLEEFAVPYFLGAAAEYA